MSNETLLKNAIKVLNEPDGLENVRSEIENAKYRFGLIDDPNIFLENLIWMGAPEEWWANTPFATETGKVYEKIAPKGKSRSLLSVAERIQSNYCDLGETPEHLLTALYQESDWFGGHLRFSTHFDPLILTPLWVRNLREHERENCEESEWRDKLYIEDGNHRALVYALRVLYGTDKFKPVPILWCKSWKHILCWAAGSDTSEENTPPNPKKLEKYFEPCKVEQYLCRFFAN